MTSIGDHTTVFGDPSGSRKERSESRDDIPSVKGAQPIIETRAQPIGNDFISSKDYADEDRAFFVPIDKFGTVAALHKLDNQLVKAGRGNILSKKVRHPYVPWMFTNNIIRPL